MINYNIIKKPNKVRISSIFIWMYLTLDKQRYDDDLRKLTLP